MDLRTVIEAIRRYKYIAIIGGLAAVVLSTLAFAKLDFDKFPPLARRAGPDYQSTVRLFITQPGFPWGRSSLKYTSQGGGPPVLEGDPDRFATLAVLYANIANSGTILRKVRLDGQRLLDIDGAQVTAAVVPASQFSSAPLPLVDIVATYRTKEGAEKIARGMTASLISFVTSGQKSSGIPQDQRVELQVIDGPENPKAVGGGKLTLPVLVLLTVMTLTLTIIIVLRNLAVSRDEAASLGVWERQPTQPAGLESPVASSGVEAATSVGARQRPQPATVEPRVASSEVEATDPAGARQRPAVVGRLGQGRWTQGRAAREER
jgi:hypothetical protein